MSQFITELEIGLKNEGVWVLKKPLVYYSTLLKYKSKQPQVVVPEGFECDLASVPRIPFVFAAWGGRVHREAVIHDYLYRIDSNPVVSFSIANRVFLEAAELRKKPWIVRWPMFFGVTIGGYFSYHKRLVGDKL